MKLDVLVGDKIQQSVDLAPEVEGLSGEGAQFYIGRSLDAFVYLESQKVSREHAELIFKDGNWTIKRTSSLPILINGIPKDEAQLANGDVLTIGPYFINVSLDSFVKEEQILAPESSSNESEEMTETQHISESSQAPVEEGLDNLSEDQQAESDQLEGDFSDQEQEFSSDDQVDDQLDHQVNEHEDSTEANFAEDEDVEDFSEDVAGDHFDSDAGDFTEGDDGEFGVMSSDEDSTQVLQSFAKYQLDIFGENAPFDKYLIDKNEVLIGRDPDACDIVLQDPEVSSKHAKIIKTNISCLLEDLDSANGTLLNGSRVNKSMITPGDEFIIGSTTFTMNVQSDLLKESGDSLMPVDDNQVIEVEEVVEVDADFGDDDIDFSDEEGDSAPASAGQGSGSLFSKEALQDPEKRKKLLYIAVGLMLLWMMLDSPDDSEAPSEETVAQEATEEPRGASDTAPDQAPEVELTDEQREQVESIYQLAFEFYDQGRYSETLFELQRLFQIVDDYRNARQIESLAKRGLAQLEELERQRQREIEREERRLRVLDLVERAKDAVEKRRVEAAEAFFAQIVELDPQNFEVSQLRIELDAWKSEQERKKLEEAEAKAERARMERALAPGRSEHSRSEWYRAINELNKFLEIQPMDSDLLEEGRAMLEESQRNLDAIVNPLLGRARSLREGRDLKGAFEAYREVLRHHPTHPEATREMMNIEDTLMVRSRRIYREALIAESLSLFDSAREKFLEVQQISPTGSEYHIKATEKLQNYLD